MSVSEAESKKLWGKAAGRCSFPSCAIDLLPMLNSSRLTVIGEMAHQIAKQPGGPRGIAKGGSDTYENLILLCPTHHTFIDKSPEGTYSVEQIKQWKTLHEQRVDSSFNAVECADRFELNRIVRDLLQENHLCWLTYGPESKEAKKNPQSTLAEIWSFRKLSVVIPNNKKISNLLKSHAHFFGLAEYSMCCEFIEHAAGFESNSILPTEGVPRFPKGFSEVFND
jgi:hypothetical protein